MKNTFCLITLIGCITASYAQTALPVQQDRWKIMPDGSIEWAIDNRLPHNEHLEMSGEKVSLWVQYGVNENGQSRLYAAVTQWLDADGVAEHAFIWECI